MSADYQALMILSIALSFTLHDLIFRPTDSLLQVFGPLTFSAGAFILLGYRAFEMHVPHIVCQIVLFVVFAGIYGGLQEVVRPYLRSRFMQLAYLSHIGIWSSLVSWSLRWVI